MFNGVPEQFHQFIASRTPTPLPLSLPLTLPLHVSPPQPPTFSNFIDPQQQQQQQQQLTHQQIQQHQHQLYQQQQSHLLHQLHQQQQQSASTVQQQVAHHHHQQRQNEEKEDEEQQLRERVRSVSEMGDPWEKEEVLALLRIRSSMGHGFSDFIWGHVSRKLAELGYKRSPEKCKEKYEEMNQYCNETTPTNYSSSKNYNRSFSELEALFEDHHQNPKTNAGTNTSAVDNEDEKNNMVRSSDDNGDGADERQGKMGLNLEENSGNETLENPFVENVVKKQSRSKKRKRHDHKLELLKGLCEEIVNKIMNQQEELHKKLLQDMERKEEERVSREEIWRKKEMDRVNKEIETRAKEQAIACDRETTIIEFLKKFTSSISSSSSQSSQEDLSVKIENIIKTSLQNPTSSPSPSIILSSSENQKSALSSVLVPTTEKTPKVPTSSSHVATATNSTPSPTHSNQRIPNLSLVCENPNSTITTQNNNQADVTSSSTNTPPPSTALAVSHDPGSTSNNDKEENGKRWPRDEVYSLINLRCNQGNSSSNGGEDKESTKIPLWEKISQGMSELGYKRSAKKCKEKWENINKYFRKTKDTNKKRSIDSKTCPYFHQLNTLYNQGRLTLHSDGLENQSAGNSTENHPESPERAVVNGKEEGGAGDEKNNNSSQVSAPLEFEY